MHVRKFVNIVENNRHILTLQKREQDRATYSSVTNVLGMGHKHTGIVVTQIMIKEKQGSRKIISEWYPGEIDDKTKHQWWFRTTYISARYE